MRLIRTAVVAGSLLSISCSPPLDKAARKRALSPLASLTVRGSERKMIRVTIPSDSQWQRIESVFGTPTFTIASISKRPKWQQCPIKGTELLVQNADGARLPLRPFNNLYGWSSECPAGSYDGSFDARRGEILTVTIFVPADTDTQQFLIAPTWKSTKDKLAGLAIRDLWWNQK